MSNPLAGPLLADENLHPRVVQGLRERGLDVVTVVDRGRGGADDHDVLQLAAAEGRVVLTHDSDFGQLAIQNGLPTAGIIYLRPGHISPEFVLETLDAVAALDLDGDGPFLIVAARRGADLRIRVRRLEDVKQDDE